MLSTSSSSRSRSSSSRRSCFLSCLRDNSSRNIHNAIVPGSMRAWEHESTIPWGHAVWFETVRALVHVSEPLGPASAGNSSATEFSIRSTDRQVHTEHVWGVNAPAPFMRLLFENCPHMVFREISCSGRIGMRACAKIMLGMASM